MGPTRNVRSAIAKKSRPRVPAERQQEHECLSPFRNELWGSMGAGRVGATDTMPLRDMKVPGFVPNVDGDELNMKEAWRHRYQHGRRQRRQEEKLGVAEGTVQGR